MIICQQYICYFILLGSTPTFDVEPFLLSSPTWVQCIHYDRNNRHLRQIRHEAKKLPDSFENLSAKWHIFPSNLPEIIVRGNAAD